MTRPTKPKPSPSQTLLQSTLQPTGKAGEFDTMIQKAQAAEPEALTTLEVIYAKRHHESLYGVNWERVQAVKTYRANGATLNEIAAYLKGKPGCSRSMIAKDLAALSEAERKTQ